MKVGYATVLNRVAALGMAGLLAASMLPSFAQAKPTAAEKRAEAQAIMEQIDAHQTEVNDANQEYARASAAYEAAQAAADEAQAKVDRESEHIAQLRESLGSYAVDMYKIDGSDGYLDALMATGTLDDFLDSWNAISAITNRNIRLIEEAQKARAAYEDAQRVLAEQSDIAAQEKEAARGAQVEAANAHDALVSEAARITAEVAALQAQEEVLAEEARKAEEDRKLAEAKAAEVAKEKEAQEQAAAEQAEAEARASQKKAAAEAAQAATDAAEQKAEELGVDTTQPVSYALLQNPCPGAVNSSGFGYRSFDNAFHKGLDMAAPTGTPYYAAESGTVIYATNDGGYNGGAGNWVVISHGNGLVTKYMHSSRTYVSAGEEVVRGQHIGDVGETGEAFGAHLHFQVEIDGAAVNPESFI